MDIERLQDQQRLLPESPEALTVMVNTYRWAKLQETQQQIGRVATYQGWQTETGKA